MTSEETVDKASRAFDELVEAMPQIADAVKAFPEAVQGEAFDALMASLSGDTSITTTEGDATATKRRKASTRKVKAADNGTKATRRRGAGTPTMVKDLNLAPKGKKSLKDFAAEKNPQSQNDRSVVSVYYLGQLAGVSPVTIDHVFTCYRSEGWQIPKNLPNSLATTASKKGFIDTADLQDITISAHGINRVEHALPEKPKE